MLNYWPYSLSKKSLVIICLLSLIVRNRLNAQGCSDAGFCTAGTLHNSAELDTAMRYQNSLGASVSIGQGEQKTTIVIPQLEYRHFLGEKALIEVKLPYYIASGNLGSYSGIGDPIITLTRSFIRKENINLDATAGIRIGTGNANGKDKNKLPLPMPYQQSLGTTDLILVIKADWKDYLSISTGYQQPLAQYNENGYNAEAFPLEVNGYNNYFNSTNLQRKGDILFRVDAHYQRKQFRISAGPLLICHLGKDKATDLSGKEYAIEGSDGITLNITAGFQYTFGRFVAGLTGGAPVITRKNRPDGLTRSWIFTPGISYTF
jgi:hypothetical protein